MVKLRSVTRVSEVADTAERLLKNYQATPEVLGDEFLSGVFTKLETSHRLLVEAIKSSVSLSKLDEADALRDEKIKALEKVLNGYQNLPIEDLKQHGQRLYAVFSKYGLAITKENYVSESGLIEALLKDLSVAELQASISALSGVAESIEGLRTAQQAFNLQRLEYEKAQASKSTQDKASSIKKVLLAVINNELIPYINTMKMVKPSQYTAFAELLAKSIETTNEVVKRRSKNASANKE